MPLQIYLHIFIKHIFIFVDVARIQNFIKNEKDQK